MNKKFLLVLKGIQRNRFFERLTMEESPKLFPKVWGKIEFAKEFRHPVGLVEFKYFTTESLFEDDYF